MARRTWRLMALVAVVAMVGIAPGVASAGNTVERPLRLTYSGEFEVGTHACEPGYVPIVIEGEGNAAGLGRFEMSAHHCDDFVTGGIADGVVILTAANGDRLYGTYEGSLVPHPDGTLGCLVYEHLEGGTGRFEQAAGEGVERSAITMLTETSGLVEGTVVGTVAYDASDRSAR